MLTEKFYEVLKKEGVVSIVSWGNEEPHITNTWNTFLVVTEDERILIPAAGLRSTENDVNVNPKVKVTLGSKEVIGFNNYQGTGFLIEGTARFIESGNEFDMMHTKYPFANRVLEITVASCEQKL